MPRVRRIGHQVRTELPLTWRDAHDRAQTATPAELAQWIEAAKDPKSDLNVWERYGLLCAAESGLQAKGKPCQE